MKASLHKLLAGILAGVLILSVAAAWAASGLDSDLKLIREVQQKKVTLQYLADPRSKAFLTDLLKDFPEKIRKNFRANITGAYRKQLLANYDAKMAELTGDILAGVADDTAREKIIGRRDIAVPARPGLCRCRQAHVGRPCVRSCPAHWLLRPDHDAGDGQTCRPARNPRRPFPEQRRSRCLGCRERLVCRCSAQGVPDLVV